MKQILIESRAPDYLMYIMPKTRNSIFFLGLLSAFSLVTFDLYQPSLPYITNYFETTHSTSQLTLSIYLFVFGITQIFWGPMIDHFGRQRLLPGSLLLALIGSLICAFAPNIGFLILGRALQGFALCCSNLIAFSTSRDFEDAVERAKILSYISMIVSASPIFAPVLGSLIFTYFGWQCNFILMAGMALLLFIQARKSLIESPFWTPPKSVFKIKRIIKDYKAILAKSSIWSAAMIMMFSFTAVMLTIINSTYLIIDVLGFSTVTFGIIFMFNGLNIIVGNYVGIWLRERFNMTSTIFMGNWLIILGGTAMLFSSRMYGFNLIALSFSLICNLGISVSAAPTMSLALSDFKEKAGMATAFISSVRLFGASLLSMITGYLLVKNLEALPLGLIGCGIGALYYSWLFKRQITPTDDAEMDGLQTNA
jgi:DHA1 family bicyclomycin/chloramphenicol resistance-like MFS transporter